MFPDEQLDDAIKRIGGSLDHSPNSPDTVALEFAKKLQIVPQAVASGSR